MVPDDGAVLSGSAVLDAKASDLGDVTLVRFRATGGGLDDVLLGTATLSPYGWILSWDTTTVPDGFYALTSVAHDAAGNITTSTPTNIAVNNGT
jgi:hypothetical protein